MGALGQILLADDEQTFLLATGDLLRREGYTCDCVSDAAVALARLRVQRYDVLIADIKMPGNDDLELARALPLVAPGVPVILVTGYPSQDSAIKAVQLPVVAYLPKPVEFTELQDQVATAVRRSRLCRVVTTVRERIEACHEELGSLEQVLVTREGEDFSGSMENFLDLTFDHISGALSDVKSLATSLVGVHTERPVCHLLDCPRLAELRAALEETTAVLQKTKRSFKSKELAALRTRLEMIMKKTEKT